MGSIFFLAAAAFEPIGKSVKKIKVDGTFEAPVEIRLGYSLAQQKAAEQLLAVLVIFYTIKVIDNRRFKSDFAYG